MSLLLIILLWITAIIFVPMWAFVMAKCIRRGIICANEEHEKQRKQQGNDKHE